MQLRKILKKKIQAKNEATIRVVAADYSETLRTFCFHYRQIGMCSDTQRLLKDKLGTG